MAIAYSLRDKPEDASGLISRECPLLARRLKREEGEKVKVFLYQFLPDVKKDTEFWKAVPPFARLSFR
jgi:hypothetical protein